MESIPDFQTICEAAERISKYVCKTPILTCETINKITKANIFFKCENFQKVGAFKFRGATNAILSLSQKDRNKGVATHSSGNHAQAVALAALLSHVKAYIVMPNNAPNVKRAAVQGYGAEIFDCLPTLESREEILENVMRDTGAVMVHPYDDYKIIAGQATAAKELIEDCIELNYILTPVGGGGLLSGTALAAKYLTPQTKVIAGEPEGADDAYRSLKSGKIIPSVNPDTVADGLLTSLGERNFEIIKKYVNDIITVSDQEILNAMKLVWERMKIIIEPSAAVPLAAVIKNPERFSGSSIGIILSGGNVDFSAVKF